MKKERIMVDGIKYRYIINDSNEIELNKEVSKEVLDLIKQTLIKKGKYNIEINVEVEEDNYMSDQLKERFKKWATVELKMYRDELDKKDLSDLERKVLKSIEKEIERRMKYGR